MILETIPAIKLLTVDEKIRLAWELMNEVSSGIGITPEVRTILDQRTAKFEAESALLRTTDEITTGIRALKNRIVGARK